MTRYDLFRLMIIILCLTGCMVSSPSGTSGTDAGSSSSLQITPVARLGKGTLSGIVWSSDGKILAVGSSLGVYLYDAETLEELRFIDTGARVFHLDLSPDGRVLATVGFSYEYPDNFVQLWDTETGHLLRELSGHRFFVTDVAFHPSGHLLATSSAGGTVQLWNLSDDQSELLFDGPENGQSMSIPAIAFSPDGRTLAVGGEKTAIRLWDVESRQLLQTINEPMAVRNLVFSPDSHLLALGLGNEGNKALQLRNVQTGQVVRELLHDENHLQDSFITDLAFSSEGNVLASVEGSNIRLWNVETGQLTQEFKHSKNLSWALKIATHPTEGLVASTELDYIRIRNMQSGQVVRELKIATGLVYSVAFSPNGHVVAAGNADNTVTLWDTDNKQIVRTYEGLTAPASSLAFSPDGRYLAIASSEKQIRLWDVNNDTATSEIRDGTLTFHEVAFSPNGHMLAAAGSDNTVLVWDATTGQKLNTFRGSSGIAFSSDGQTLATVSSDEFHLWDLNTGKELHSANIWDKHGSSILSIALRPNSSQLALGRSYPAEDALLWPASAKSASYVLEHRSGVKTVAFSPDGRLLTTGASYSDHAVRIWNPDTGQLLGQAEGHTDGLTSVSFSPDGSLLASGSDDGTVRLWRVRWQ